MTARVSFDFTGTTALITGGTSGIGNAIAAAVSRRRGGRCHRHRNQTPAAADYEADLSGMAYAQLVITDPASIDAARLPMSTPSTCWSTTPARTSPAASTNPLPTASTPRWHSTSTAPTA